MGYSLRGGIATASPCWGRAVRGSRCPHWRQVLVAALTASLTQGALASGNLLRGTLLARRHGDGLSLNGGRGCPLLPAASSTPGPHDGTVGLYGANILGGGQPAWRRTPCMATRRWPLPDLARAVHYSRCSHRHQVLLTGLAALLTQAALTAGNLLGGALPARRHIDDVSLMGGRASTVPGGLVGARSSCRR